MVSSLIYLKIRQPVDTKIKDTIRLHIASTL